MELDPRTRLAVVLASIVGILACHSAALLLAFLFATGVLAAWRGRLAQVLLSLLRVIAPIVPLVFVVWGALVPMPSHSEGLRFATLTSLRLLSLLSLMLMAFGELGAEALSRQLRGWGLGRAGIAAVLGTLTLWPEIRRRAHEIVEARYAQGLLPRRSVLHAALSLPFILRPLVTWSLRSAIGRAESWERRGLLAHIGTGPAAPAPHTAGLLLFCVAMAWTAAALWMRGVA